MKQNKKKYIKTTIKEFLNENIEVNNISSQLDKIGVKYELSGNEYKPFKVIYKPINKSDEFYKIFNDIIFINNLESVVKY
jgi:hypothetical protein